MGVLHQSYETGENVPKWIFILRFVLGLSLILKGYNFIKDNQQLQHSFAESGFLKNATWLISVIPWLHLIGGILILVGLFTRLASVIQIPILFGAVIFVNLKDTGGADLPFSFLILVLVVVFTFVGAGNLSMDNSFRKPLIDDRNNS